MGRQEAITKNTDDNKVTKIPAVDTLFKAALVNERSIVKFNACKTELSACLYVVLPTCLNYSGALGKV